MTKQWLDMAILLALAAMWATARSAVRGGVSAFVISTCLIFSTIIGIWMVFA